MPAFTVLALSGSLRAASLNSMLLRAAARLMPVDMRVQLYTDLGRLPLFNPDLEALDPPPVAALRAAITVSARLIDDACISVPLLGSGLSEDGILQHGEMCATLIRALTALRAQTRSGRPDGPAFDLR